MVTQRFAKPYILTVVWVRSPRLPPNMGVYMPQITIDLKKWYKIFIKSIPLLALLGSGILWIDARHMHKDIADIRWLDVQISIINGHILDYTRIENPDAADDIAFKISLDRLNFLTEERSQRLGLKGLPE